MILDLRDDEVFELLVTLGAASKGRLSKERRETAGLQARRLQTTVGQIQALRTLTQPPAAAPVPVPPKMPRRELWLTVLATWVAVAVLAYLLWT